MKISEEHMDHSSCPMCQRNEVLFHDTYPIEHWICIWCKDVFVKDKNGIISCLYNVRGIL